MSSHDFIAAIERYPCYNDEGVLVGVSYGCPEFDLMGYTSLADLLFDIHKAFMKDPPE